MSQPINAQTDDKGLRYYEFNGQKLLSVTSYRRVLGLGFGLHNWVIKQVVDAAVMTDRGPLGDDEYRRSLWKAARAKRDAAANLGTAVHEAAEVGLRAVSLPKDVRPEDVEPFLNQFHLAMNELGFKTLLSEAQVFNLTLAYAGSLDLVVEATKDLPKYGISKGDRIVVDLKTGKGIYNDHALQLGMYFGAEFVGGYDPFDDKDVIYPDQTDILNSVVSTGVLHLRPDEWEYVPIPITDELAAACVDLTRIATWFISHPTIDTLKGATK